MAKSKIEWLNGGYSINPVRGLCPMACSYCYARRMYKRFHWNPEIRMEPDWAEDLPKKPSRIFVGSTMELFGDWVEDWMWEEIWKYVNDYPQHTFIFLTKKPENLIKWSPFPENCWVGVTATDRNRWFNAVWELQNIKAQVKFISFEPLLGWQDKIPSGVHALIMSDWFGRSGISWVICGQQTPVSMRTMPKVGWVEEIVSAADKANIPVFLKDNLISCVDQYAVALDKNGEYRQEFPKL